MLHEIVRRVKMLPPRPGPWMVRRPRLDSLLDQAMERPLILVSAPAGFGKTSLLSQWSRDRSAPSAWLSLDASDNDLTRFVTSIVTALQPVAPGLGADTLALARLSGATSAQQFACAFADEYSGLDERTTIIMDDYHLIENPEIHDFLGHVLSAPPPCLRIAIASRTDPTLPLASLRAHGMLTEVRGEELRFTLAETRAFLRLVNGSEPDHADADALHEFSEGWITVLYLAALAGQGSGGAMAAPRIDSFANRSTVAFLVDEVVDRQPMPIQDLLERIALPSHISEDLARALSADDGDRMPVDVLGLLERSGTFLFPVGENRRWRRFHPIVRAHLVKRLETRVGAQEIIALHQRAQRWFASNGHIDEAISHALVAHDHAAAAAIIVDHIQLALSQDRLNDLDRWIALLPIELAASTIEIVLAQGWINHARGRSDVLAVLVDRARSLLPPSDTPVSRETAVHQAEIELLAAQASEQPRAIDALVDIYARSLETLQGTDRFAEAFCIFSYCRIEGLRDRTKALQFAQHVVATNAIDANPTALTRLLWARAAQTMVARHDGDVQGYAHLAQMLVRGAMRANSSRLKAFGHAFLGVALYEQNWVEEAAEHFRTAMAEPGCGGQVLVNSAIQLALCQNAQGRPADARATIMAAMDRFLESEVTLYLPLLRSSLAHLALARGDKAAASAAINALAHEPAESAFGSIEMPALVRALAWLLEGAPERIEAAGALLADLREVAVNLGLHQPHVQVLVVEALRCRLLGNDDEAAQRLAQALAMGERAGYVRTFLDLGPEMKPLLEWYGRSTHDGPYVTRLLREFDFARPSEQVAHSTRRVVPGGSIIAMIGAWDHESLTERELDVLLGLQRRLSNKEIADELAISPLTIKTHTRNIYGKLGVNSRRQAIARAIAIGLLPGP